MHDLTAIIAGKTGLCWCLIISQTHKPIFHLNFPISPHHPSSSILSSLLLLRLRAPQAPSLTSASASPPNHHNHNPNHPLRFDTKSCNIVMKPLPPSLPNSTSIPPPPPPGKKRKKEKEKLEIKTQPRQREAGRTQKKTSRGIIIYWFVCWRAVITQHTIRRNWDLKGKKKGRLGSFPLPPGGWMGENGEMGKSVVEKWHL